MKLMLDIQVPQPGNRITYNDHILLMGSCFTGNVGKALQEAKFSALYNPTGILFDPLSVVKHLNDLIDKKTYTENDLFHLNELWASWHHHSEFSSVDKIEALHKINSSIQKGAELFDKCTWLFITLGTSFSYHHIENNVPVANCHMAPSQWFDKRMLSTEAIINAFDPLIGKISSSRPDLNIVFTISPVRHVRDGVIENTRSKARLIEAVHSLIEKHKQCIYFPAYELVLDVLRDHRFYENDLVHPNQLATQYVFDEFCRSYLETQTFSLMEEVKKVRTAFHHRPFHPGTQQHRQFLSVHLNRTKDLQQKLPQLDWSEELNYFSNI